MVCMFLKTDLPNYHPRKKTGNYWAYNQLFVLYGSKISFEAVFLENNSLKWIG